MAKRRAFVRRLLVASLRAFLRDNVVPILMLVGLYLVAVGIGQVLGGDGYWQGFSNGFLLASMIAVFLLLFLLHTGGINQVAGLYGESRTDDELQKARGDGSVWTAVNNIELADGDIDSVVFTPAGVLAVETKWRMRELDRRWIGRDLAQAQRAADKARAVLRSKNVGAGVHEVLPVLVIWGKASLDVAAGGEHHEGVHVVDGNELRDWLKKFNRGTLAEDHARAAADALGHFQATQVVTIKRPRR